MFSKYTVIVFRSLLCVILLYLLIQLLVIILLIKNKSQQGGTVNKPLDLVAGKPELKFCLKHLLTA